MIGDKANHVPAFHVPQVYYFVGFASIFGWPALATGEGGVHGLVREVWARMFGTRRYAHVEAVWLRHGARRLTFTRRNIAMTGVLAAFMALTIYKFTYATRSVHAPL